MRLLLVGDFREKASDEGMRKLSRAYLRVAERNHEVVAVSTSAFCSGRAFSLARKFRPRAIHYITGPSIRGLMALWAYKVALRGRVVTIATGLRPTLGPTGRRLLTLFAPRHYLAQAVSWERLFAAAGSRVVPWPNPVDLERFKPASSEQKVRVREKWGLGPRPVLLHVGHVKPSRRLESLIQIARDQRYQVVIVGSESLSSHGALRSSLENAGCHVHTKFVAEIQEFYQSADAYIFPVIPAEEGRFPSGRDAVGSIDLPLSVLEAMACNIPVVTTRYDALMRFLQPTPGLRFYDGTSADALRCLEEARSEPCQTRDAVRDYGMDSFASRLEEIYGQVAVLASCHER